LTSSPASQALLIGEPLEPSHHVRRTERLEEIGASPPIGTIGDSFDNAMAESVIGLFNRAAPQPLSASARNGGPWKSLEDLDMATCA
jgi:putative transposase